MNKVVLRGYLGKDPELRYTPSGAAVCNFSLATSRTWKDQDGERQTKTQWHRCIVWNKLAEMVNNSFRKGDEMLIDDGEIEYRTWEDNDGIKHYITEIKVRSIEFLRSNKKDSNNRYTRDEYSDDQPPPAEDESQELPPEAQEVVDKFDGTEDDLPF